MLNRTRNCKEGLRRVAFSLLNEEASWRSRSIRNPGESSHRWPACGAKVPARIVDRDLEGSGDDALLKER